MTHDDFLRAIAAAPDDGLLRQAYADWLDEDGQEVRAEFVRLQLELEPLRERLDLPRVREMLAREEDLLREHEEAWLGPVQYAVGLGADWGDHRYVSLPRASALGY